MKIAEKFVSINGEGLYAGELAVFIRFAGCNLNCSYCDTKWANEVTDFAEENYIEIYNYINSTGIRNVTLTGGEPLLADGIVPFLEYISEISELNVEIETNGSVDIKKIGIHKIKDRLTITMDVKCPSSGMSEKTCFSNLLLMCFEDVVKFVVSDKNDLEFALGIINKYKLTEITNVILSPVYQAIDPKEIVAFMTENKLNGVRLGLQLHKIIWDDTQRGV